MLFEIVNILEKNNIHFFIQAGVVLGARRDGNFIKWDWDVEIGIFEKEFIKNYDLIKNELIKKILKFIMKLKMEKMEK